MLANAYCLVLIVFPSNWRKLIINQMNEISQFLFAIKFNNFFFLCIERSPNRLEIGFFSLSKFLCWSSANSINYSSNYNHSNVSVKSGARFHTTQNWIFIKTENWWKGSTSNRLFRPSNSHIVLCTVQKHMLTHMFADFSLSNFQFADKSHAYGFILSLRFENPVSFFHWVCLQFETTL